MSDSIDRALRALESIAESLKHLTGKEEHENEVSRLRDRAEWNNLEMRQLIYQALGNKVKSPTPEFNVLIHQISQLVGRVELLDIQKSTTKSTKFRRSTK